LDSEPSEPRFEGRPPRLRSGTRRRR
jgi:hypothetical protein